MQIQSNGFICYNFVIKYTQYIIVIFLSTGGAIFTIAMAAAGVNVAVDLNSAADCDKNAKRLRKQSASTKTNSQSLISRMHTLNTQKMSLEDETRSLDGKVTALHDASVDLLDV